ncbi:MAG: hypothetical protein RR048_06105 [Oscillospiraceae bacterium]
MIRLIVGKKGSGKTKELIDSANIAIAKSKGNVVCIEKGPQMMYNLDVKARLINIDDYRVDNYDAMYGFISGILAANYDVTDIFIDGIFKTVGKDTRKIVAIAQQLKKLTKDEVNVTFTVSCDASELPETAKEFIK